METSILNLLEIETSTVNLSFIERFCTGTCGLLLPFKAFKSVIDYVSGKYSRVINGIAKVISFVFKGRLMRYLIKLVQEKFGDVTLDESFSLLTESVLFICIPPQIRVTLKYTVLFSKSLIVM